MYQQLSIIQGPIAGAMIDMIQGTGGIMTLEDLENYKVRVAPALNGTYKGRKVYTSHAPTSGPVLLHMLNLLENFDLSGEGRTGLNVHRLVEVLKCQRIFPPLMSTYILTLCLVRMELDSLQGMYVQYRLLLNELY